MKKNSRTNYKQLLLLMLPKSIKKFKIRATQKSKSKALRYT